MTIDTCMIFEQYKLKIGTRVFVLKFKNIATSFYNIFLLINANISAS